MQGTDLSFEPITTTYRLQETETGCRRIYGKRPSRQVQKRKALRAQGARWVR
jgi:hypothetical protein